jgi:hypothetical protein
VTELVTAHPPRVAPSGAPVRDQAHERLEEELGDLLFSCVNLCRKAGVHASLALDRANAKFARRFQAVEALARERGLRVGEVPLAVLDGLWDEVKAGEPPVRAGEDAGNAAGNAAAQAARSGP